MIQLVPFLEEDFDRLLSWIETPKQLQQFAGSIFSFPLTANQLLNYIQGSERSCYKIKLVDTDIFIGCCEINYERPVPRLCRILIGDQSYRNKGYGKLLVNQLLHILFAEGHFEEVDLNVYDWNKPAMACYQSIGFEANEAGSTKQTHNGEIWTAINMRITKDKWNPLSV